MKQQAAKADTASPKLPVYPRPDPGCEDRRDNRKSDLCAQWKAADAAYDAARWGWWQVLLGAIGLLLGAVTMGAAIAAAVYARRAAVATEETVGIARDAAEEASEALAIATRNADAAASHVRVAEDTAKRQLRAYVMAESLVAHDVAEGLKPRFSVNYHNRGQTPAYEVRCTSVIQAVPREGPSTIPLRFRDGKSRGEQSISVLGPGQAESQTYQVEDEWTPQVWEWLTGGYVKIIFVGIVSYRDIFGRRRLTTFKYALQDVDGKPSRQPLVACERGNNAN